MTTDKMDFDEQGLDLRDYLAILRRRKKEILIPAVIVFGIAVLLAFLLPPSYKSQGTILIEQQEIPADLVRSTVTSYAGERIQIISQRVMTTENLGRIIQQYDLFKDQRETTSLTALVEGMRKDITLDMISADVVDPRSGRPTTATIAFTIGYAHEDPRTAQRVANEIVSLFLNENLKQRTQSAVETSTFLQAEADKLAEEVAGLEAQLAEFKEGNLNNLPELQQLNIQLMERAERDLKDTDQNIRALEERVIYLSSELAQISPTSDLYGADGKRMLSAEDRLKSLQTEFIGLSARYSATHPDLVKISREIEALKKETGYAGDINELDRKLSDSKADLALLRERYSAEHPDVKKAQRAVAAAQAELDAAVASRRQRATSSQVTVADNPAYIQLQAQRQAAEVELRSLRQAREETKAKIAEFENRLMASPQVEREYRNLTRDYENALAKYREVSAKQREAELAKSLERENKGERFSLLEPPLVPEQPSKPNRLAIVFLGFVLSIGSGIGAAALAEGLNSTIKSPRELMAVTSEPPLIVIPYITTDAELASQRALRRNLVLLSILLGAAAVAAVHYLVMPLDVLWYAVMRKLGLPQ